MSHLSPQKRSFYSRIALASIAFLIVSLSLFELVGQMMPVSAAALTSSIGQNQGLKPTATTCPITGCTPTPIHSPTPKPTHTPTPTPTNSPTPTATSIATGTPTGTPTATSTSGSSATPTATPTSASIPPGASTPLPGGTVSPNGTPLPGTTQTAQTQTNNGNPPPPGGGNNTPSGGSPGGLFTIVALVLGLLAFLLYLLPQGGASRSILNKLLSLLLPSSVVRRLDEE